MISDLPEPLQPNTVWSSGAIEAPDRMLWFPTQHGAVRVDPAHIFRNPLPPPVRISAMIADNRNYSSYSSPILPPATQNLVIRYDALSLTVPERVRFRYKLDPWDKDWHFTDGRREAFFTHLTPGSYVFHIIASNNSDVWNNEGATLNFVVEPTWYQTGWFRFACVIAAVLVLWSIYRLRLRQIAKSANERFDERLGERIRIARELHDTLVQTIQGSKMVVDDALETSEDPARARHALKQLSTWLEQATEESRAALYSLRSSVTVKNDLAEALRRATESDHSPNGMSVAFSVVGTAREMHPLCAMRSIGTRSRRFAMRRHIRARAASTWSCSIGRICRLWFPTMVSVSIQR
jgi:signal transduction histidine kinase